MGAATRFVITVAIAKNPIVFIIVFLLFEARRAVRPL
jgi:hypothetical protein